MEKAADYPEDNQYLGSGQEGPEVQGCQRSCPARSRDSFKVSHLWKQSGSFGIAPVGEASCIVIYIASVSEALHSALQHAT